MRKALLIGINSYPSPNELKVCLTDVDIMNSLLATNGDGSKNFDVTPMKDVTSSKVIMAAIEDLFKDDAEIALLYFSGHGRVTATGAEIVIPSDCNPDSYYMGIQLSTIMDVVHRSPAKNKVIILDSCHAGGIGKDHARDDFSKIATGVTILAACKEDEGAGVFDHSSRFTGVLATALQGAAADYIGRISLNSLYSYTEAFFGDKEQRPIYKTNTEGSVILKTVKPRIPLDVLKGTLSLFADVNTPYPLDSSFEETNNTTEVHVVKEPYADADHVKIFKQLQKLESIGFITPVDAPHMYGAAMNGKSCRLTPAGAFYWLLAKKGLI